MHLHTVCLPVGQLQLVLHWTEIQIFSPSVPAALLICWRVIEGNSQAWDLNDFIKLKERCWTKSCDFVYNPTVSFCKIWSMEHSKNSNTQHLTSIRETTSLPGNSRQVLSPLNRAEFLYFSSFPFFMLSSCVFTLKGKSQKSYIELVVQFAGGNKKNSYLVFSLNCKYSI